MVIAYIGIVAVIVALFTLNSKTIKADAARSAAVARCISSRPVLLKFRNHIQGVNELGRVLVVNSRSIVEKTRPNDPQYRVRVANLSRLSAAQKEIAALPTFHVPTVAQCKASKP